MSGEFTPRPGAAPFATMVRAQAVMESRLMMRNGEQVVLAVVIPVVVLLGGVLGSRHLNLDLAHRPVDILTPGVLALAVMSTAFTSLAISTGFDRRYGVIKRLGSSPLPRSGLLLGKVGALLLIEVFQVAVVSAVGFALGWRPEASGVLPALVTLILGTAAFAGLGLLVSGVLRAEATLAAANLIYLLLMAGGAVVLPAAAYGGFGEVTRWLPSGALGESFRTAFLDGAFAPRDLVVLALWSVVGAGLTSRTFRWE